MQKQNIRAFFASSFDCLQCATKLEAKKAWKQGYIASCMHMWCTNKPIIIASYTYSGLFTMFLVHWTNNYTVYHRCAWCHVIKSCYIISPEQQ